MPPPAPIPSTAQALDYAPPPTARRRWMRRLRRGWPVGLLLLFVGLGIAYGPGVWRRWQVIKLQEACMRAQMPADRPVEEHDPTAARALVAAWPGEYRMDRAGWAVRVDSRWAALAGELGLPALPYVTPGSPVETGFCHERHTPNGQRRLVVIEGIYATVIEPADWPVGRGPRVLWRAEATDDPAMAAARSAVTGLPGPTRSSAGIPDPADPARFTMSFVWNGVPGTWEYVLRNDGRITMRMLDLTGFIARARAAKARAATQPAQWPEITGSYNRFPMRRSGFLE